MKQQSQHPLEANEAERVFFTQTLSRTSRSAPGAYRRAVEACTGSLPSWARRGKPGRKPTRSTDAFRSQASGDA